MAMPLVEDEKGIEWEQISDLGIAAVKIKARICPDQYIEYSCQWTKIPDEGNYIFSGHVELLRNGKRAVKSAKWYTSSLEPGVVRINDGIRGERSQYIDAAKLEDVDDGRFTNPNWLYRPL